MGFDLSNASGGYLRFSGAGWALALTIAKYHGWQPAGTPRPASWKDEDGPWKGEYAIQCGQQVTHEDAAAFAIALERAVSAGDFVESAQRWADTLNDELVRQYPRAQGDLPSLSRDDAERFRKRLTELAQFARQGSFTVA